VRAAHLKRTNAGSASPEQSPFALHLPGTQRGLTFGSSGPEKRDSSAETLNVSCVPRATLYPWFTSKTKSREGAVRV